jgi:pimeloyl-ACP methyl ester carboxylesterase
MKKLLGFIGKLALVGLILVLTVPFFIPVESSGTKSYREAAPKSGDFVRVQGVDVFYERTPFDCDGTRDCSNPPLFVLLHGFGANTFSFREIASPLSKYGEVVAYDRPGFGFTERPVSWDGENPYGSIGHQRILTELISYFGQGKDVYLVGHSAGGTLAAQYALDNPSRVKGLILISPAILTTGGTPGWLNWVYDIPQLDRVGPLLVSSIASSGMDLLNRSWFNPDLITAEIKAGYRAPLEVKGWERGFWEFNKAPRVFDVREKLSELTVPTLLITGVKDEVVPTGDTELLAELIPNAIVFVIPKSGHLAQEETPEETMKAIRVTWSILSR